MAKCSDCGFSELERGPDKDPVTKKPISQRIVTATCTYDLRSTKKISNPFDDRKCKNFTHKRPGWTTLNFHQWKDRHITNRRNFGLSIFAVSISLFSLFFGVIIPLLTPPPPEVELEFPLFHDSYVAPANSTILYPFTIYNKGSKICFIARAELYQVLESGWGIYLSEVRDAREKSINPGETMDFKFEIFSSQENVTRQYYILVYYEPSNYITSPQFSIRWYPPA